MPDTGSATPPAPPKIPDAFLSPTGSLTPAAAGAVVLIITNALGLTLGLPRFTTALVLSAIIGALIVARFKASLATKAGYWIVNSLTIYAVAMGSNATFAAFTHGTTVGGPAPAPAAGFWAPWL